MCIFQDAFNLYEIKKDEYSIRCPSLRLKLMYQQYLGLTYLIKNDGSYLLQAKKLVVVYVMSSFVTFLLVLVPQDIASHAN